MSSYITPYSFICIVSVYWALDHLVLMMQVRVHPSNCCCLEVGWHSLHAYDWFYMDTSDLIWTYFCSVLPFLELVLTMRIVIYIAWATYHFEMNLL